MHSRLFIVFLIAIVTCITWGCEQRPIYQDGREFGRSADKIDVNGVYVVYQNDKQVATITHKAKKFQDRSDGWYEVEDSNAKFIGMIEANSGTVTIQKDGQPQETLEVVDVTTNDGLAKAARFMLRLDGFVNVLPADKAMRRAN